MSYTTHKFQKGDTLYASDLNEMDEQIAKNESEKMTKPSTASVGQFITVKKVDSNGVPTEYEAVDAPTGSGSGTTGADGVGIKSIEQTTKSTADDGVNVVTVTMTNNETATFEIQNGSKGSTGNTGPQGPAGSDATVTSDNIKTALGYTPANESTVSTLSQTVNNLVVTGGGITETAKILLLTVLKSCYTSSNQDANIEELEQEILGSGGVVILSSISATYSGGAVLVGTALTDLTGIVVTANYSDGTTKTVSDYTLSGNIADGSNTITVSYGDKTTTFTVIGYKEEEEPITLTSISATYTGGEVEVGTALTSLTGIKVTGTYSDGSKSEITGYTLSGTIAEGSNTITVSYNGLTTTFVVTGVVIEEVVLTSISAVANETTVAVGTKAEDLDITVTAHYSDGTTKVVTDYSISGTVGAGENTFTIVYGGKTTTVTVTGQNTPIYAVYDTTVADYTDSGVNPFDEDKDVSIFIDASIVDINKGDTKMFYGRTAQVQKWAVLVYNGGKVRVQANGVNSDLKFGGEAIKVGDNIKAVLTRKKGSTTFEIYWYQKTVNGVEYWQKDTDFEVGSFVPMDENLTMMKGFSTYNLFEIYANRYVTEAEALVFTGGTAFTEV